MKNARERKAGEQVWTSTCESGSMTSRLISTSVDIHHTIPEHHKPFPIFNLKV